MSGILIKRGYMTVLNKTKLLGIITISLLVAGCGSLVNNNNFASCVEAQKSMSKDMVVMEAARIQAIVEMTKSADPGVRAAGVMLLQKTESKSLTLDCLK